MRLFNDLMFFFFFVDFLMDIELTAHLISLSTLVSRCLIHSYIYSYIVLVSVFFSRRIMYLYDKWKFHAYMRLMVSPKNHL